MATGLERVLRAAAAGAAPGYPAGNALSAQYGGAVAPLPDASATPGDLRIAAWSDGARKLVLTAIARTGKQLFAQVDGDVLTTNTGDLPSLPNP